jgi:NADH dehydrogenase
MATMPGATGARPRVIVIGGGFGGAFAVQRLARRLRPGEAEVLLIDRNN